MFGAFNGFLEVFRYKTTLVRSSAIGILAGIIPGIGGVLANFLAYSMAVQFSKNPEKFGTGIPEGIIASEASNDAKDGGALLPTIIFGIPGSAGMAVLLGAFILHGLQPGFFFIREHMDIVFVLIFGFVIANFLASLMAMFGADILARVTTLRVGYVVPAAFLLSIGGAYAARENVWDIGIAIVAGILGFAFNRFGFSLVTLVIGFLLGVRAELSLRAVAADLRRQLRHLLQSTRHRRADVAEHPAAVSAVVVEPKSEGVVMKGSTLLGVILVATSLLFFGWSFSYRGMAGFVPLVLSIPTVALAVVCLAGERYPGILKVFEGEPGRCPDLGG